MEPQKLNQAIARGMGWRWYASPADWRDSPVRVLDDPTNRHWRTDFVETTDESIPLSRRALQYLPDYLGDANASCTLEDHLHGKGIAITSGCLAFNKVYVDLSRPSQNQHLVNILIAAVNGVTFSAARRRCLALCAVKIMEGMEVEK